MGLQSNRKLDCCPSKSIPQGYWEFAHLISGEATEKDQLGKWILDEKTAIILVLLPEGTFWMGAERTLGQREILIREPKAWKVHLIKYI